MKSITFEAAEQVLDITSGPNDKGWYMAHCPSHSDSRPSLAILEADNGNLIPKCLAGCTAREVYDAIRDLLEDEYL